MKRTALSVLALAGAASLAACSPERAPTASAQPQLSAAIAPCQQGDTGCVDPMLVIDGKVVSYRELQLLGPEIQSIEVFKGEAARAKFGDAGRHGVIVVTTKRALDKS